MAQQTAVEWLFDELYRRFEMKGDGMEMDKVLEQALQMEKENHEITFNESRLTHPMIGWKHTTFDQYYNETFKPE